MGNGPAPFSEIRKIVEDLFTKGYQYDKKISLSVPGLTLTFKEGKSNVDTLTTVSTNLTVNEVLPHTKAELRFEIPDCSSGKLDVQYLHPRVAIGSSIGLNSSPLLDVAAAVGYKDLHFGGEVGFDTAGNSFTKYTAGIGFFDLHENLSIALFLMDKGQTLKLSSALSITSKNLAFYEIAHRFSSSETSFNFGSAHIIDRYNKVKTKFWTLEKWQCVATRIWRPNSLSYLFHQSTTTFRPKFSKGVLC
ncbi:Eukaryotic porin/Tom40 [Artemisia annua]|uniref:Eukaryotic porin/Tom40 n=1 Tax=Artemisia annua TaxID=35608 RepID=A0A2U1PJS6_ARTAN|nr:Eukaryotic porin/Tom40 [Artemisia annua]